MPTQLDYETARALALETLSTLDLERCSANAGLSTEIVSPEAMCVQIPYLGRQCRLIKEKDAIFFDNGEKLLKIPDQVLLLHYLITAKGVPVGEEWITFREVPSGHFYYDPFSKRAIKPLLSTFGQNPSLFGEVAQVMGQLMPSPGDTALKVLALPRVPIVLSLWRGDDEFGPEANVHFDQSIVSYLSTEDIAYLSGAVVYKAIGIARQLRSDRKRP
jgi:hypothetical protein